MESIGKILQQNVVRLSPTPPNLPDPRTTDVAQERRWQSLNVSSLTHTFDTYRITPKNRVAFLAVKSLTQPDNTHKFCLIYGVPGNGKTHLLEAFCLAMDARYNTMSQIMRTLKSALREGNYERIFKNLCNVPRLVIDDYGAGVQETAYEVAEIEDIVNERYHRRYRDDGKITVLATNQDIRTLPDRIVRRFRDPEFGILALNEEVDFGKQKRMPNQ